MPLSTHYAIARHMTTARYHTWRDMMDRRHYVIRGGVEGRERLRIIGRVLRPTTQSLFEHVGLRPGMACLDVGCGGGDVAFELARLIGRDGTVIGMDIDATKIQLAACEAEQQQLGNVEFQHRNIFECDMAPEFDLVYARFLLTHL